MDGPNEKVCEELFLMYAFMRVYRLRRERMVMYAPTIREEKDVGYDAKTHIGCRELYLQFKRANVEKKHGCFSFAIDPAQLKILKGYPYYSAFYVVGAFDSITQLNKDQQNAKVPEFLDRYLAIPAHLIDDEEKRIYFQYYNHRSKSFKQSLVYGTIQVFQRQKPLFQWFYGDELLQEFLRGQQGAIITHIDAQTIIRESTNYVKKIAPQNNFLKIESELRESDVSGLDTPQALRESQESAEALPTTLRLC